MIFENSAVAVVSGGASGLGAATARKLSDMGARVVVFDLNIQAGEAVAQELGGVFQHVDVADPASVAAGFEAVRATLGTPRVMSTARELPRPLKPYRAARRMTPRSLPKRSKLI